MRAQKIGIVLEKNDHGKYNLYVVGIDGDRVVSSLPDLETRDVSFGAVQRRFELVWQTLRLRLSKKQVEFTLESDLHEDSE